MIKLTPKQRQTVAREYETRKSRGETALDIAIRWNLHPIYVSTLARRARTNFYTAQRVALKQRAMLDKKRQRERVAARKRLIERRARTKAKQDAILRDYLRGAPIEDIARKHKCDRSYPVQLAKRAGCPPRGKLRKKSVPR
jgi:hypothetical protein